MEEGVYVVVHSKTTGVFGIAPRDVNTGKLFTCPYCGNSVIVL